MDGRGKREFLGTGFHFPLEIDETTGRFRMSSEEENIKESIKLILMTGRGERVMRPEFGCGLKQFVYETMDYGTTVQMEREIKEALERWEPRIEDVEASNSPGNEQNTLMIQVSFRVRATNNPYNYVFPFYLQEGFE